MSDYVHERYPNHKVVGVYSLSGEPSLVICDLYLAKRIFIKDFDSFPERRSFAVNPMSNKLMTEMIVMLPVEKWRVVRPLVKAFTHTNAQQSEFFC